MDSLLVTPTSEADLQLLTALFKKTKIKTRVLPDAASARSNKPAPTAEGKGLVSLVPQNRGETNMLDAVLEMQEILAGRKEATTMEDFWKEVRSE